METRVSAWRAFRNRSSRATPAGMPSACLRKFCESLMSRSSREGVCGCCCMAQQIGRERDWRSHHRRCHRDLPVIFGSRFPRQPGVHTNRMGELISTGPGFVFRDRPHSRSLRTKPAPAALLNKRLIGKLLQEDQGGAKRCHHRSPGRRRIPPSYRPARGLLSRRSLPSADRDAGEQHLAR